MLEIGKIYGVAMGARTRRIMVIGTYEWIVAIQRIDERPNLRWVNAHWLVRAITEFDHRAAVHAAHELMTEARKCYKAFNSSHELVMRRSISSRGELLFRAKTRHERRTSRWAKALGRAGQASAAPWPTMEIEGHNDNRECLFDVDCIARNGEPHWSRECYTVEMLMIDAMYYDFTRWWYELEAAPTEESNRVRMRKILAEWAREATDEEAHSRLAARPPISHLTEWAILNETRMTQPVVAAWVCRMIEAGWVLWFTDGARFVHSVEHRACIDGRQCVKLIDVYQHTLKIPTPYNVAEVLATPLVHIHKEAKPL